MRVVLAEKPSVARDIARFLNASQRHEGYLANGEWAVTWAFGHMVELKEPDEYNREWKAWRKETLPMLPDVFELRPRKDEGGQKQLDTIEKLFRKAEEIVCATDAGREGELIFRYILSYLGLEDRPFHRLWISSLTGEAIADGFRNLLPGSRFDNLYHAAKCRSEADWIVGLNATRFFTVSYGGHGTLWSVGRVQTPVLAMIVGRDLEIENFKPEDYWELHTMYREVEFKSKRGRIDKKEDVEALKAKVDGHDLEIVDVKERAEKSYPPPLFDLTALQREMNQRAGMTADQTLRAAQNLYEKKLITYPRTDSRYLSSDLRAKIPGLLRRLRQQREEDIDRLDLERLSIGKRIVDDSKVSDHHAIIPTGESPSGLNRAEHSVYDSVLTRFIAVFHPPCEKKVTTVTGESVKEKFQARGTVIVKPGWWQLYPYLLKRATTANEADKKDKGDAGDTILPEFAKGERGPHAPFVKELQTTPPKRFTESSLLNLMETAGKTVNEDALREVLKNKGIGTPATRASIIEVLIARKYVHRRKKNLISTAAGRQLIELVRDERLKSAELTGEWEAKLKEIETGKAPPSPFMEQVVDYTRDIIGQDAVAFPQDGSLGPCPMQGCEGRVIQGKRGYGCSNWRGGCGFRIIPEQIGADIGPQEVAEIIQLGMTVSPTHITTEDRSFFARIKLADDKSLEFVEEQAVSPGADKDSVGNCPMCGGAVVERPKSYSCVNWRNGCKFVIWRSMCGKRITKAMARKLLSKGETEMLKNFKAKSGRKFEAKLKLEDGKVSLEFPDRDQAS